MFEVCDQTLVPFTERQETLRRQDAPKAYEHNGAMYLARTKVLQDQQSYNILGVKPYVMNGFANLDIDEPEDFEFAEFVVRSGKL